MIPTEVKKEAEKVLSGNAGITVQIKSMLSVGGGCINHCFKIISTHGNYFLKYNDKNRFPKMFEAEAKGLRFLANAKAIKIPEVMGCDEQGNYSFIVMEFIESGLQRKNFFRNFGIQIAKLHCVTNEKFGFQEKNYIGSLAQSNTWNTNGIDFFIEQRLAPQLKSAYDLKHFSKEILKHFESLYKKLPEIIPKEKPTLLHGDLWSGNFLTDTSGNACLIDPAVYFGFREQDIAMSKLFGGFDNDFYEGYNAEFPLEKGWQEHMDVFNIYPLLVHVNLFGKSYARQVFSIVKKF